MNYSEHNIELRLGDYQTLINDSLADLADDRIIERIWQRDYTVWNESPVEVSNRLGWLSVHDQMRDHIWQIEALYQAVQTEGYTHALLLGMGGSSLAPELFSNVFAGQVTGLRLEVLDSTDPAAVAEKTISFEPQDSLYIVSTKSGGTVETLSFFKYFYNLTIDKIGLNGAGRHFVAITDPGSQLVEIAQKNSFRDVFLNDPNIGGRYSALSYFGLLPGALVGVDIRRLINSAAGMSEMCGPGIATNSNPAALLGTVIGELAKVGRDKLTLLLPEKLESFGDWVEQLIAESLGKRGQGVLPVVGEPLTTLLSYADDRVIVIFQMPGVSIDDYQIQQLENAGHPIITITLDDIYDLGGQILMWELATAVAGSRMGINPFDQPNVEAAKNLARQMVADYQVTGQLPIDTPILQEGPYSVYGELDADNITDVITTFIGSAIPGDYIAIQAFVPPTVMNIKALQRLRTSIRSKYKLATTLGFGPRFLHSTGQLHKGDAGNGLFVQITTTSDPDIPIPDEAGKSSSSLTFGVLKLAQALGDQHALVENGRRVLRIHVDGDFGQVINQLAGKM